MWPFRSKKEPEDTTERFERVEKAMRRLEEEWSDVYHKFRVLQMRVAKQVQRLDANSSQEEPQGAEGDGAAARSTASSLSPRLQRIQNEILERRRRGTPVAKEGGE
jgi:predicted  nucleic acid-binding Zn-ribbon protein